MSELIWEDPGPRRKPKPKWSSQAEALRAHPRIWLRLVERGSPSSARTLVSEINRGALAVFTPAGDYEAEHRGCVVYARFMGDGYGHGDGDV